MGQLWCTSPTSVPLWETPTQGKPDKQHGHPKLIHYIISSVVSLKMSNVKLVGGWTNPFEKRQSNWIIFPGKGSKSKNIWNHHHLVKHWCFSRLSDVFGQNAWGWAVSWRKRHKARITWATNSTPLGGSFPVLGTDELFSWMITVAFPILHAC